MDFGFFSVLYCGWAVCLTSILDIHPSISLVVCNRHQIDPGCMQVLECRQLIHEDAGDWHRQHANCD